MFICSVKGNTLKLWGIIALALALVTALAIALPGAETVAAGSLFEGKDTLNYDKIKTEDARHEFLSQFGWEVSGPCVEEVEIRIPVDFDKVMNSYNEIQKSQGLDLSKYKGKTVQRYTYEVTNYPDYDGTVYANIIIYKSRVIGGDICSSDVEGFIQGFEAPKSAEKK
ncbi:MAG: DUF4830 domain-containing protein [Ruminococcaceae bacterium]|nr:DUF4830 domain-containing protein [Oscillospiraceae bacterium]